MAAPGGSDFVACANLGIGATRAPLVHVLAAGCKLADGWADAALKHFDDPRVAAVAPLVLQCGRRERVLAAGIGYSAGGSRRQRRPRFKRAQAVGTRRACLAPAAMPGFYRKSALEAVGGWTRNRSPQR